MEKGGKGFARALDLLSRRDHSEAELRRKLLGRGIDEGEVEETVTRLRSLGYLNDRRVAERLAESAAASGRMVGHRLRMELSRRGIPADLAEEALARVTGELDERGTIAELLDRKFSGFDPATADMKERRRIVGWFQRRGFSLSAILECLRVAQED